MSKKGKRLRAADERRRSSLREMIVCFLFGLLLTAMLLAEASYVCPQYAELETHHGAYSALNRVSKSRSRGKCYRLLLKDGECFYVHRSLDAEAFEAQAREDEELIVLADARRGLWRLCSGLRGEAIAFEIRTEAGETLLDYASSCVNFQKRKQTRMVYDGALALLLMLFALLALRNWKKYDRELREMKARKGT